MGLTISFIFCLLSGLFAFWLFWKCVDWFEKDLRRRRNYVCSIICIGYCGFQVVELCVWGPEKFKK